MTDNLVAAMKPEIRFKCSYIKKEDIKIIIFFFQRFGGTMPLFLKFIIFLTFIHTIQSHSVHPSPFAEARLLLIL